MIVTRPLMTSRAAFAHCFDDLGIRPEVVGRHHAVAASEFLQVDTGAEGLAITGDNNGQDGVIRIHPLEGIQQRLRHVRRQCVERVGAIQRQERNTLFHCKEYKIRIAAHAAPADSDNCSNMVFILP